MTNLTADHIDARLKWCQSYKNKILDLVIFSDETDRVTLEKIKRSG